jgi:hypothetical protein
METLFQIHITVSNSAQSQFKHIRSLLCLTNITSDLIQAPAIHTVALTWSVGRKHPHYSANNVWTKKRINVKL